MVNIAFQYKLIDDSTKVKDVFMLKTPTEAPRELAYLFDYQLSILNTIRVQDEQDEADANEVSGLFSTMLFIICFLSAHRTIGMDPPFQS